MRGDVLIDAKPAHVIKWQEHNPQGVGILWAQPYNAQSAWRGLRLNDWGHTLRIVRVIADNARGQARIDAFRLGEQS